MYGINRYRRVSSQNNQFKNADVPIATCGDVIDANILYEEFSHCSNALFKVNSRVCGFGFQLFI